jgi:hypothetical protein
VRRACILLCELHRGNRLQQTWRSQLISSLPCRHTLPSTRSLPRRAVAAEVLQLNGEGRGGKDGALAVSDLRRLLLNQLPRKLGGSHLFFFAAQGLLSSWARPRTLPACCEGLVLCPGASAQSAASPTTCVFPGHHALSIRWSDATQLWPHVHAKWCRSYGASCQHLAWRRTPYHWPRAPYHRPMVTAGLPVTRWGSGHRRGICGLGARRAQSWECLRPPGRAGAVVRPVVGPRGICQAAALPPHPPERSRPGS